MRSKSGVLLRVAALSLTLLVPATIRAEQESGYACGIEVDGVQKQFHEPAIRFTAAVFGRSVAVVGSKDDTGETLINTVIGDSTALQKSAQDGFTLVNSDGTLRKERGKEVTEGGSEMGADQIDKQNAASGFVLRRIRVRMTMVLKGGGELDEKDFIAIGEPAVDKLQLTVPVKGQADDVIADAFVLRRVRNGTLGADLPGRSGGMCWVFDGEPIHLYKAMGGKRDEAAPEKVKARTNAFFSKPDDLEVGTSITSPAIDSPNFKGD